MRPSRIPAWRESSSARAPTASTSASSITSPGWPGIGMSPSNTASNRPSMPRSGPSTGATTSRAPAAWGLHVGAHFILGLPGETDAMLLDQVERINALPLTTVKFHQLQVFRATPMAAEYDAAPERFRFWEPEEYIDLFVEILRRLRPGVVVERFASEAPPRYHYGRNWGLVRNEQLLAMLERRLEERNVYQGEIFTTFAADKLRQR